MNSELLDTFINQTAILVNSKSNYYSVDEMEQLIEEQIEKNINFIDFDEIDGEIDTNETRRIMNMLKTIPSFITIRFLVIGTKLYFENTKKVRRNINILQFENRELDFDGNRDYYEKDYAKNLIKGIKK